jgi:hypothetical protein
MIEFDRCVAKHTIKYEDQLAFLKMAASKLNYVLVKPEKLVKTQNFGSAPQQAPPPANQARPVAAPSRTRKGPAPGELQPGQTTSWKKDPELKLMKSEFRRLQLLSEAEKDLDAKEHLAEELQRINVRIHDHSVALRSAKQNASNVQA